MSNLRPIPHFTSADARASALQKAEPMNPPTPTPTPEELQRLFTMLGEILIRLGALEDRLGVLESEFVRFHRRGPR